MTEDEIRAKLRAWFDERQPTDPDAHYLDQGGMDSFEVIQLIQFAESSFGIAFAADDFQQRDFFTVNGLARMIAAKG